MDVCVTGAKLWYEITTISICLLECWWVILTQDNNLIIRDSNRILIFCIHYLSPKLMTNLVNWFAKKCYHNYSRQAKKHVTHTFLPAFHVILPQIPYITYPCLIVSFPSMLIIYQIYSITFLCLNQSCNEDLQTFWRFPDSPPPQGKILPIEC